MHPMNNSDAMLILILHLPLFPLYSCVSELKVKQGKAWVRAIAIGNREGEGYRSFLEMHPMKTSDAMLFIF